MKPIITITIVTILFLVSCEKEKIEYKRFLDEKDYYSGFVGNMFILHKQSISYYSPEENKVFSDIYFNQNGTKIKNEIYSFSLAYNTGFICYENNNLIERIDLQNFTSTGTLSINRPRYVFRDWLVSYGEKNNAGIGILGNDNHIVKSIPLSIEPGKIFVNDNFYFVLSSGKSMDDSLIYRLYEPENSPNMIHKLDSIVVGKRPVDCVSTDIEYPGYFHEGLAILCEGDLNTPASIVLFDLVSDRVVDKYYFESTAKPENLYWLSVDFNIQYLVSHVNNKVYSLKLSKPIELSLITNKNVSKLVPFQQSFLAVSRDTAINPSFIYTFNNQFNIIDSLKIDADAKSVGRYYDW